VGIILKTLGNVSLVIILWVFFRVNHTHNIEIKDKITCLLHSVLEKM